MAEKMTFLKLTEQVLESTKKPMSAVEIWEYAEKNGLTSSLKTSGKTPWNTISAQTYMNIKDAEKPIFYQYSSRPARFYLKKYEGQIFEFEQETQNEKIESDSTRFHERALHSLVAKFIYVNQHFKAYLKTIYHENSKKKKHGYNEWLHPDLVGIYFPFEKDFDKNALELQKTLLLSSIRLFSFELKKDLNWNNLRPSYFQAVSNSSWAHEGYLVTLNMEQDDDFRDELRRLNNAFGIGIIKINPINLYESEILFASKTKEELDWETINRLAKDNDDFKEFIQRVTKDAHNLEIRKELYDKVLSDEELDEYIKSNKIA